MDLPVDVLIHNESLGAKGKPAVLLSIHPVGYYEVTMSFGDSSHRTLLPIHSTVVITREAEEELEGGIDVER